MDNKRFLDDASAEATDRFMYSFSPISPEAQEAFRTKHDCFMKGAKFGWYYRSCEIESLFDVIKHGDENHQRWLKDKIVKHFSGTK